MDINNVNFHSFYTENAAPVVKIVHSIIDCIRKINTVYNWFDIRSLFSY